MEQTRAHELAVTAQRARILAMDMVHTAGSGHIGGSLSVMDLLTTLYFHTMKVDPKAPADPGRDRFVLSKGHCTPALYAMLALRGYFPVEDCKLFRSIKGHMSGHPDMRHVPGVDMSTGSLARGSPPPWAWPWPASWTRPTGGSTPSWATARWRKARCGRPPAVRIRTIRVRV